MGLVYKFTQALIAFAGLPSPTDTIPPPCLPTLGRSASASLTSTAGVSLFRKESAGGEVTGFMRPPWLLRGGQTPRGQGSSREISPHNSSGKWWQLEFVQELWGEGSGAWVGVHTSRASVWDREEGPLGGGSICRSAAWKEEDGGRACQGAEV